MYGCYFAKQYRKTEGKSVYGKQAGAYISVFTRVVRLGEKKKNECLKLAVFLSNLFKQATGNTLG